MKDKNILVIDNEAYILKFVKEVLSKNYTNVNCIRSSIGALELIANTEYDLVLSDIDMPEINGVELIEKAKKIKPNLKYLFMSGRSYSDLAQKAKKLSRHDIMHKPFDLDILLRNVEEVIDS